MENRYKVILSNNNLYKEIELFPEMQQARVGTAVECDYRLHKHLFFGQIELFFSKTQTGWSVVCSDNLYITVGDVRKLATKQLVHGDILEVHYQDSDIIAFTMEFLLDFDDGKLKYERVIDLSTCSGFTVGTAGNCHLVLKSPYVRNDYIEFTRQGDGLIASVRNTTYGMYHNGKKAGSSARIQSSDFFSVSDYFFYYKNGQLWTAIRPDLAVNGLKYSDRPMQNQYPKFNRNTRIKTILNDEKIEILDPSPKPQKPKNNVFMRLLPGVAMLIASIVMAFFGGAMIIMSVLSGAMGLLTTIMGFTEANKDYKRDSEERIGKYQAYIGKKRGEIEQIRMSERNQLEEIYTSANVTTQRLANFSADLFDRTADDEDFLCVRLGNGQVESVRELNYKKQERLETDDELQMIPEQMSRQYKYVQDAPIVCDLKSVHAVGVVGTPEHRFGLFKNMVIDIVARQFFSDVKLFLVARETNKAQVKWLRFLPHVYNEELQVRNIVCDDESKSLIFEYLYKELTLREQSKCKDGREHLVVFFCDEYGFKNHPISKFVEKAKELNVTFVFFGDVPADIPQGCGYIISLRDGQNGTLIRTEDRGKATAFTYSPIPDNQVSEIVKILAPVYTEEISLEGNLTKNISMFEMLNILAVDDIDLASRWQESQVFKSMAAPLGVTKTGVICLDLHDKAHGPHGLVAGTTGSGKSEILQTYILAMATLFHPHEVGFVIIDFKGGGMVNQFKELPHLMGAITNIDGKEINRSLKSIKAELQKRQRYFAAADVNHIDKYIKKYKAGQVDEPLPHLIIIVDEFAELKAEQPEFMKELISAARIGRSLGVHLILATQKPSGQVNEQIWSNSRFKLCLKVQSQEDSNEVLKSPLAAEIKEPGRAYLQVGNNEIFELFQSAYSGAPERADDANVKEFTIYGLNDSGRRVPVFSQKKQKSGEGSATQLDAIVRYVHQYCEHIGLEKLPDICLPSLSRSISFAAQKRSAEPGRYEVELGIYDDPENQYQGVYSVDIASNNLLLIGSSQSGKTNVLQNIIRSLSAKYTPDEVNIYAIDFASMVLKNFEKLNHVGGVVCSSDDEKLKNLFKLLFAEMELRKEKLMSVGVSSFAAYKESGRTDMPLIVLLVDNLTALKEIYFQDDDELLTLCREGLTVGLSVVIANSQTNGIGYKYLSNFSTRIALFCNDSNEYSSLFDHCSERLDSIPGRCIIEIEKQHRECQTYLSFDGDKEIDRVASIKTYIEQTNSRNKGMMARRIPVIPATLTQGYIAQELGNFMQEPFQVVAGLDYATVTPYVMDLANQGFLAISGREGAGKHNWLKYAMGILETVYPGKTKAYVVDGIGKKLMRLKNAPNTVTYTMIPEDAVAYIRDIEQQLKTRYDALVAGDESVLENSELLLLVLENPDAVQAICNDRDAMEAYRNIIGRYKNMKACVIAFVENANIPYSAPEILKGLRDQRNILFFGDMNEMKIFDPPLAMLRSFKKPIEQGDGYYIRDNLCVKMKTPMHLQRNAE